MLNDGILAVSEELKAIIEDLEFGVHQFFPIDIIPPRGVCPKKFFTMVIGNYRNSFEDTAKTLPRWSDDGPYKFSSVSKKGAAAMTFRESQIGKAHIWRERLFSDDIILFSDDLVEKIHESGLKTPAIHKAKEIL